MFFLGCYCLIGKVYIHYTGLVEAKFVLANMNNPWESVGRIILLDPNADLHMYICTRHAVV